MTVYGNERELLRSVEEVLYSVAVVDQVRVLHAGIDA